MPYVIHSAGGIVGAGAQGRIIAVLWRRACPDADLFFVDDDPRLWNSALCGVPVRGPIASLEAASDRSPPLIVAIGNNWTRTRVAEQLQAAGFGFATVVDPSATVMPQAELGQGVLVGPGAVIHIGATVAAHAVINTSAIVEHDSIVEEGASLSPGVRMGGRVHIEKKAFVSTGATLCPRVRIGQGAIVGAGAVVTRDVPVGSLVLGCPARVVRQATDTDWARLF